MKVPAPSLVRLPPTPDITPAMVVLVASPVVNVLPASATVVPEAPANEPMVSLPVSVRLLVPFSVTAAVSNSDAPSTLTLAALFTVTTAEAIEPVTSNVPAFTTVGPR